jgi:hypothetical protein
MAAVNAAEVFELEVVRIPQSSAGEDVKVPSVYLEDILLAEIGGLRDGIIEEEDLMDELERANVSRKENE